MKSGLDKYININLKVFKERLDRDLSKLKHSLSMKSSFTLLNRDIHREIEEIIIQICDNHLLGLERKEMVGRK